MPPTAIGLLVAIYAGVSAIAAWPAGVITDRIGGRVAVALAFAGAAVFFLGVALAASYAGLVAAMVVAGFANSLVNPATNHVIAETVDEGRRGLIAGVKMAGVQVAVFAVGVLIPFFDSTIGWRAPLAVGGSLVCFGGVVVALRAIERSLKQEGPTRTKLTWTRGLFALTTYSILMGAGMSAALTYLPLYSVDRLNLSLGAGGLALGVVGLLAIVGRLYWGRRTERSRIVTWPLLLIGVASALSSLALLAASRLDTTLLWIGAAGLGFFALSFTAATTVALILTVERGTTGTASGVMFAGFMVGFGVGPTGFGLLVESRGGYTAAWMGVTLAYVGSVIISLAAISWEKKRGTRGLLPP